MLSHTMELSIQVQHAVQDQTGGICNQAFQMTICFLKEIKDCADETNSQCPKPRVSPGTCADWVWGKRMVPTFLAFLYFCGHVWNSYRSGLIFVRGSASVVCALHFSGTYFKPSHFHLLIDLNK